MAALTLMFQGALSASAAPTQVSISGESAVYGIFDPSLEFASGATEGWLAYSAVYGAIVPFGPHVDARLARTTDAGLTFTHDRVVNASWFDTLVFIDQSTIDGVWNYETSSLAHDPDDPGAEWKLFSHRVFRKTEDNFVEEQNLAAYSWIVYRTAPTPTGPWSPEHALFSSGPLPPAPYDNVQIAINDLDPSLASMLVYSEPGAIYHEGVLYVSMTGLTASGPDRIVLLASDDHGATWRYVGTPLTLSDAAALGFLGFDGSAIAKQSSQLFLLSTPESLGVKHDGTLAIEFDDITTASLVRDLGVPVVTQHFPQVPGLPVDRRGGQADFHEEALTGLIIPSLQLGDYPEMFQIYATGESILGPAALPSMSLGALAICAFSLVATAGMTRRTAMRFSVDRPRGKMSAPRLADFDSK
jgi:hypothetical protein